MNMRNGQRPTDPIDVVVVGAGQAGLAVSYHLRAFGVEHIVLERGQIGESWRSARWNSFTLVTPSWMTRLPGYLLAAGAGADFLSRDSVLAMLEQFAHGLPVRTGVEVVSVTAGDRGYQVVTPDGIVAARAVVIAGGGQRSPAIPAVASRLPAELHQCHAGDYRSPGALPQGAVLVVGSGQSGTQIADELATAGREVMLATGRVARVPRSHRGRDIHEWSVDLGLYDQPVEAITDPAEFREPHPMLSGARGGHTVALQQLSRDGVRLLGRLIDAEGTRLRFAPDLPENMRYADQRATGVRRAVDEYVARAGIAAPPPDTDPVERPLREPQDSPLQLDSHAEQIGSVIWCTGFGPDTAWSAPAPPGGRLAPPVGLPHSPAFTWLASLRIAAPGFCTGSPPTPPASHSTSPLRQVGGSHRCQHPLIRR